jgi:hypothetical protein
MVAARSERLLCGGRAGLRGAIRPGLDLFALLFVSRQKVERTALAECGKEKESEEYGLEGADLRVDNLLEDNCFLKLLVRTQEGAVRAKLLVRTQAGAVWSIIISKALS